VNPHRAVVGVVADDLTGAADAIVEFATPASRASVVLDVRALPGRLDGPYAIDTDSRVRSARAAARRVAEGLRAVSERGDRPFLKIDSLLRGHPGTAAAVALDVVPAAFRGMLVTPASPSRGRRVRDGLLIAPQRGAFPIAEYLHAQGGEPFVSLPLDVVRDGPAAVMGWIDQAISSGVRGVVADAETGPDLTTLGTVLAVGDLLPVGSAGLAAGLATVLNGQHSVQLVLEPRADTLIVVGSRSVIAGQQVAELAARGVPVVRLPPVGSWSTPTRQLIHAMAGSGTAVLCPTPADVAPEAADPVDGPRMASRLGRTVREVVDRRGIGRLVLVGGDTARAAIVACEAKGLHVQGPGTEGSAVGSLWGSPCGDIEVVTRAGAFGSPTGLLPLVRIEPKVAP
jgi:D-threonate/D-erythronate kinase